MLVYELAKELAVTTNDILRGLKKLGVDDITKHTQSIDDGILGELKSIVDKADKATKPWNADYNPWALDMLSLKRDHKGFVPRWVSPDMYQRRKEQGWVDAERKHYKGVGETVVGEEGELGTTIKRRELILMEMPVELAKQREKYYAEKTRLRSVSAQDIAKKQAAKVERELGQGVQFTSRFDQRVGK